MVKDILSKDNRPGSTNRIRPQARANQTIDHGEKSGGRFRPRSRTPNQNAMTIEQNDMKPKTLLSSKMLGSTIDQTKNSSPKGRLSYGTITSTMSVSKSKLGGVEKTNLPGPGSYNIQPTFPKGSKPCIQTKGKWDSLFGTKIAQSISPGPAKYSTRGPVGGTHQTIAQKYDKVQLESKFTLSGAGPGDYDTNTVKHLRRASRVTIGNSTRTLIETKKNIPGPDIYNSHKSMTDRRSNSAERNAPRCTIGNAPKELKPRMPTPGPNNYNTTSLKQIGDAAGVKVPFTTAVRPISAKPGQIRVTDLIPGPQDYKTVQTDKYLRRKSVIPKFVFSTAGKDRESEMKI